MATVGGIGERPDTAASGESREASFRRFYDAEFRGTYAFLLARTGDRWVAEELLQEAFARAYRDWDRVRTFERPGGWLRTVAANLATSRFRRLAAEARATRRLRGMRNEPTAPHPAEHHEFWAEVRRLPQRQAEALVLHYVHDLPVAEIADTLGCAEGTAKSHLHRGRRTLARRLGLDNDSDGEAR